jgi:murein DD-endopeptidase MepM/ murein hydrolase activator NlpD
MRRFLAVLGTALLLLVPLTAARSKKRSRRTPPRRELKVSPSEAIEARVQREIEKAEGVLGHLDAATILDSPYVISGVYYHDGFLSRYPVDKQDGDPARRIISQVTRLLTAQRKDRIVLVLHELCEARESPPGRPLFIQPVPVVVPTARRSRRFRRTHQYAVDLFGREGSPVHAATAGVVLLAENGWNEADPFSTSSHAGGNTVIMFDPASNRFLRYCHMAAVTVIPGALLEAGQEIGVIGHSGLNASRYGHGGHVHFEVNEYAGGEMRPLDYREIWALLRKAAAPA